MNQEILLVVTAGIAGLFFGSFASLAAHRIPKRETIVRGRSRCPNCGATITAKENIPLVSFIVQRGRCRHCGAGISFRYPVIEVVTGALFALAAWKFDYSLETLVYLAFFWALVVLSAIDLEHRLLPNRVVYPAFVIGWGALAAVALADADVDRLLDAALGMVIFGGFFFVVALVFPAGMGGGDVKLAFVLGTFLGYLGAPGLVVVGMFLSFLLGALFGVGLMALQKGGRKTMVPFGPFLALGTVITVFVGQSILDAYLKQF
jgi:leader peptidase (prepilin peptidase)/N-methyltransferase